MRSRVGIVTGTMDRVEILRQLLALAERQLQALAADDVPAAEAAMQERGQLVEQWDEAAAPRTDEELREARALTGRLLAADQELEERLRAALEGAETSLEQLRRARRTFRAYGGGHALSARLFDKRG